MGRDASVEALKSQASKSHLHTNKNSSVDWSHNYKSGGKNIAILPQVGGAIISGSNTLKIKTVRVGNHETSPHPA